MTELADLCINPERWFQKMRHSSCTIYLCEERNQNVLSPQRIATLIAVMLVIDICSDQTIALSPPDQPAAPVSDTDLHTLETLIQDLAIEHIPHQFKKNKDWGKQKERWDGLHIQLKNFRLKTKRRKKLVNHGTWKKYSAELVDPRHRMRFHLHSITKDDKDRAKIDLSLTADLKLFGRLSEWVMGVQLFSLSADATAKVTLQLKLTVATRIDLRHLPPDLILDPKVDEAKLVVHDFQVHRVSKAGGEFAQQVTKGVRKVLDKKIVEQEKKLVQKLNRSIAKKKDRLRVSVKELIESGWSKIASDFLPEGVDNKAKSDQRP